uniref:Uncharacterized protein n=1 Tax=Cacopsylla melanoneura TaxID=428564 RepID=A0A8D8UUZ6_9HEMI
MSWWHSDLILYIHILSSRYHMYLFIFYFYSVKFNPIQKINRNVLPHLFHYLSMKICLTCLFFSSVFSLQVCRLRNRRSIHSFTKLWECSCYYTFPLNATVDFQRCPFRAHLSKVVGVFVVVTLSSPQRRASVHLDCPSRITLSSCGSVVVTPVPHNCRIFGGPSQHYPYRRFVIESYPKDPASTVINLQRTSKFPRI